MRVAPAFGMVALCATTAAAQNQRSETVTWMGPASRGGLVQIRNIRGDISVQPGGGRMVEVVALKTWRRGDSAAVRIQARQVGEAVMICVLWGAMRDCDSRMGATDSRAVGDVSVHLSVRVPDGMRLSVTGVNGDVTIESESRVLLAETLNGNVVVHSSEGTVVASTVNGTVTAYLTEPVHATVDIRTRGRLQTDFALQLTRGLRPGRMQANIGNGGRRIELQTATGDVALRRARSG